jgi:hypothetical protein
MRPIALYFVMESMIYGDLVVAMVIDRIRKQLEAYPMASAVIPSRMPPGRCDEEVGVNGFVEQCVYGVGARAVL